MRKAIALILLITLLLCGCGKTEDKTEPASAPQITSAVQPTPENIAEDYASMTNSIRDRYEDRPFTEFTDEYGQPNQSEHVDSTLGNGGEGIYYYDHFTVYTIINNGEEYIADVR